MSDQAAGDPATELRSRIEDHLRRYGAESSRLIDIFAKTHAMHPTDFQALVLIMNAERQGTPTTPGALGRALSLTSGAVTGTIDRLAAAGHVTRSPDEQDRRQTRLHWQGPGLELATQFFGPLGARTEPIMAGFTVAELGVIEHFMGAMAEAIAAHREALESGRG